MNVTMKKYTLTNGDTAMGTESFMGTKPKKVTGRQLFKLPRVDYSFDVGELTTKQAWDLIAAERQS